MDLSIFEQALALRAEVDKAGLDDAEPDFSAIVKHGGNSTSAGGVVKLPDLPNEKVAVEFMVRGAALAAAAGARAGDQDANARDLKVRQSRIADLLRLASAPLPEFDPKAGDNDPKPPTPIKPSVPPTKAPQPTSPTDSTRSPTSTRPSLTTPARPEPDASVPVVTRPNAAPARPAAKTAKTATTAKKTATSTATTTADTKQPTEPKPARKAAKAAPKTPPKKKR